MSENYPRKAEEICGDMDAVRKILVENHELRRTRAESEAIAEIRGYKAGFAEAQKQLRALVAANG